MKALLVVGPLLAVAVACSSSSASSTGFGHDASASSSSGSSSGGGSGSSSGGTGSSSGGGSGSSSGSGGQCATATDCKTHAENCGTCVCIALGVNEPAPDCDGGTIKCTPDPCTGHTVTCDSTQSCVLQ